MPASLIDGERVGIVPVDQFDRGVEPLRIVELGQVEEEFGLRLGRRQPVADEAVICAHSFGHHRHGLDLDQRRGLDQAR